MKKKTTILLAPIASEALRNINEWIDVLTQVARLDGLKDGPSRRTPKPRR